MGISNEGDVLAFTQRLVDPEKGISCRKPLTSQEEHLAKGNGGLINLLLPANRHSLRWL
jgi:hypothetical protein